MNDIFTGELSLDSAGLSQTGHKAGVPDRKHLVGEELGQVREIVQIVIAVGFLGLRPCFLLLLLQLCRSALDRQKTKSEASPFFSFKKFPLPNG